ncbi:MAG: LysR family transcriptional regulator [Pseudomonadota bacterium]
MFNFTLKQLRYVEAAGRLGSISAAAQELNISQSSITAAIGALEQEIGYDLFMRTPARGISATPSGVETLSLIRRFIEQSRHFESEMRSVDGDATGSVRIACYATAAPSLLPPIFKSYSKRFPRMSIKLLEGDMEDVLTFLEAGEADLAFTYSEAIRARNHFEPLFTAPPYAIIGSDDPLCEQSSVSLKELSSRPMIVLDLAHTREYFSGMFEDLGLAPNIVHSSRSVEITRALVAGGFGFSILNIRPPDYHTDQNRYRILPISDTLRIPEFGIATQSSVRQPSMVTTFVDHCMTLKLDGVFNDLIVH